MAFKVGQKIVGIEALGDGIGWDGFGLNPGPRANEIYTVTGYELVGYVFLKEFPINEGFADKWFRPIDMDFVEEVIKQVTPKEVEA